MASIPDYWTIYEKPSIGRIVFRPKHSKQESARLERAKERIAKAKPSIVAHERCVAEGKAIKKKVYVAGKGYQEVDVCPINEFRRYLSEATSEAHKKLRRAGV